MSEVKKPTTYEEQIELLRARHCIIDDEQFCKEILSTISYYRLSAYFLPFKESDENYSNGTSFKKVYHIYEFDRKLRRIILSAIEVIEIYLRSQLSYFHAIKYGSLGYLDPNNFNSRHDSEKFMDNINREISNNKKVLFVKHHVDNYEGQFPIWVISELFTFGMLSYFYNDLKTSDQKILAYQFNIHYKDLISWLRCCTDLRNICAHYGRLYYRIFSAIPSGFKLQEYEKRGLWGAVLAVKALYPSCDKWNSEFMPQITSLFEQYSDDIQLDHLAFPNDWKLQLMK